MTRHPRLETTKVEKGRERIPKNPGFVGDDETTCLAIVKSSTSVRGRKRKREKGNVNRAVDRRVSSTNCTTFYPTRRRSQCSCPFFFRKDPICSWARGASSVHQSYRRSTCVARTVPLVCFFYCDVCSVRVFHRGFGN